MSRKGSPELIYYIQLYFSLVPILPFTNQHRRHCAIQWAW